MKVKKVYLEIEDRRAYGYKIGQNFFLRFSEGFCPACGDTNHICKTPPFIVVGGVKFYKNEIKALLYAEEDGTMIYVKSPFRSVEMAISDAKRIASSLPDLIEVDSRLYEVRQ